MIIDNFKDYYGYLKGKEKLIDRSKVFSQFTKVFDTKIRFVNPETSHSIFYLPVRLTTINHFATRGTSKAPNPRLCTSSLFTRTWLRFTHRILKKQTHARTRRHDDDRKLRRNFVRLPATVEWSERKACASTSWNVDFKAGRRFVFIWIHSKSSYFSGQMRRSVESGTYCLHLVRTKCHEFHSLL